MFAVGISMTSEMGAAMKAHAEFVHSALASWDAGRDYLNFTERRERGERLFGSATYRRLHTVKGRSGGCVPVEPPCPTSGGRLGEAA
jgi:hypothetical protein